MPGRKLILLLLVTVNTAAILLYPHTAFCIEKMYFNVNPTPSAKILLSSYIREKNGLTLPDYYIAKNDLNGDGIYEYILKQKKCYSNKGKCTFIILAESAGKAILLGKIRAYSLALGDDYSFGVQDILAFSDDNNDYVYDVFKWDPLSKRYILKKEAVDQQ